MGTIILRHRHPHAALGPLTNRSVIVALLAMLWTGAIGFVDDYLKIVEGKFRGLVQGKLVGQCIFGLALGLYLYHFPVVA